MMLSEDMAAEAVPSSCTLPDDCPIRIYLNTTTASSAVADDACRPSPGPLRTV